MPSPVASSSGSTADFASQPLYQVKLLAALRSGDPALIHPFLNEISRDRSKSADSTVQLGAAALHLAIRCASYDTIQLLLQHRSISPNAIHPAESKCTALHLAASLGRADVVALLLDQEEIDDTARDAKGLTAKAVARTKEIRDIIQDSQSLFRASFISLLRTYILSPRTAPPPPSLLTHLASPRASLLDLSYVDDASGTTLLHEAARRKDLRLVELAVRAGADVFVRDRRGRPVADAAGKDDRVKVFLRQFTNQDKTLMETPLSGEPPVLKGYLNKYANLARGFNTRWFVLKDGVLSYYRHQDDENLACRGSISMKSVVLKTSSAGEKLRFEVQSTPHHRPGAHHHLGPQPPSNSGIQKWYMKANHPAEAARWTHAIKKSIEWYRTRAGGELDVYQDHVNSGGSVSDVSSFRTRSKSTHRARRGSMASSGENDTSDPAETGVSSRERTDPEDTRSLAPSSTSGSARSPPHTDTIDLQGNTAMAQLELTSRLLTAVTSPTSDSQRSNDVEKALNESLPQLQELVSEYIRMAKEREEWYKEKLEKERDRTSIWEESLSVVVREGEALERELRKRGRAKPKRRSMLNISDSGTQTIRQRPTRDLPPLPIVSTPEVSTPTASWPHELVDQQPRAPDRPRLDATTFFPVSDDAQPPRSPDTDEVDTDEEDEFFDAIEFNHLPNLTVSEPLKSPVSPVSLRALPEKSNPFQGYACLRDRLPIESDDRPSTSLWQVLKGSIGKDLTKISFPVYFNEPTSMLQRMAEDMEFSECLDAAVAERDPHRRIAYVAAFAMSNYSSTIGRIAKPFNPMLGETFEYVRLDKMYRYYSEQVSHHPPISACWAEAPNWRYFGEVDAQNKFMGKSFEIRPTGVAHAELKIPHDMMADDGDEQYEHYTWKKVTTNVSGFILGSTTIDHYGEMTVTNHRTQDTCVLTFKPRGWRGKDAFEIRGHVFDASGCVTYDIAGRWNSQLVARKAEDGRSALLPDINVGGPASPSTAEYILLWRNTEKPKAPFNLTPFAVTLNDCPAQTLKPYLPFTDCRLRPDQRAFELGRYDRANELKSMQEDFQRATRRRREEGEIPEHRPRWFEAKTDRDTGERVWSPLRSGERIQYWDEREKAFFSPGKENWPGVERIFIDEAP
ncbi:Oxysterol-binding protein-domain-containing protein [Gautieria morchelliformis]|nr:Oxysterol-binding protein-domain-containing protein [Gautieria morchelliformis]